jgi:hypothetical protein
VRELAQQLDVPMKLAAAYSYEAAVAQLGDLQAPRACVEQIVKLDKPVADLFDPLRRQNRQWTEELFALLEKVCSV